MTVDVPPPKSRSTRRSTVSEPPSPEHERPLPLPTDPEEQRRRSDAALRRLEDAEAAVEAANERVLAALSKLSR